MRTSRSLSVMLLLAAAWLSARSPQVPRRDLRVLVLADEEYQSDPRWVSRTFEMIKTASADFERLFGIRLVARPFESWRSDDALTRIDPAAESLARSFERYEAELLIVLSGQEWRDDWRMTHTMFKEGLIFIAPPRSLINLWHVLERHLGRLFGAVIEPPPPDPDPAARAALFSAANREIILLNRDRTFNRPDSPSLPAGTERAIELYRSIGLANDEYIAAHRPPPSAELPESAGTDPPPSRPSSGLSDVHILLAQIHLDAGRFDQALASCARALELSPDDVEAQNTLAMIYRRTGDLEAAIRKYLDIFRRDPQFARVLFNLGVAYAEQGDLRDAQAAYEAALALRPSYAEALNNIGDIRVRQGRYEEAETSFRSAVAAKPAMAIARSNLAALLLRKGDFAGAEAEAGEAARLDPGLALAALIQGNIDRALGRLEDAAAHYLTARSLDPRSEKAVVNLAVCAFEAGDLVKAEGLFREALDVNSSSAEAHAGLGACLLKRREIEPARREIEAALALGLRAADAHLNLSSIALATRDDDKAIAEAKLALGIDPGLAEAYRNLGTAYLRKGLKRESEQALAEAARLAGKAPVKRAP